MSAPDVVVLIAAIASVVVVVGLLVVVGSMQRQVRQLSRVVDDLRHQTVPLVAEAHRVVDQAANEMERVGSVLESTESVHSTVDSASRLAYRAFANPVVKVLAIRAGAAGGVRRLRARPVAPHRSAEPSRATRPSRATHQGSR
jgi:predicted PurR-regulated permease PerM